MNERRLRELRRLHREGKAVPDDLFGLLRDVAGKFVGLRLLPPSYAPYGRWDAEAADEILQSWLSERLLGRGHLQRMLDQATNPPALRGMCEQSLRQHLIQQKARSQLTNTYRRLAKLLEKDFKQFSESVKRQQIYWGLPMWTKPDFFTGDESVLLAQAWALGDFNIVRYRSDAKKLPPVLPGDQLKRFVDGLFTAIGECLTLTQLMRVLERRFDLGEVPIEALSETPEVETPCQPSEDLALDEVALLLLEELTTRQAEIIERRDEDQTLEEIAASLGCSPATVFNEEKRIRALIAREADTQEEAELLLKMIADLLYKASGDG